MQLNDLFPHLKKQLLANLQANNFHAWRLPLGVLFFSALIVWIIGPHITWGDYVPLANAEKRIYTICFIWLIWLLKYSLIDLGVPDAKQYAGQETQKILLNLHQRFSGAMSFLNKTKISRNGQSIPLETLPWYLLVGPSGSGKSTLLAKSEINFILQRKQQRTAQAKVAKHCDWWITRDTSIIDIPGYFICRTGTRFKPIYATLWHFFLRLIKHQRGKNGINGMMIVLPLPELLLVGDNQRYQIMMNDILQSLKEVEEIFNTPIPCQLIITKCDCLPGFAEFFADSGNDEIKQAWNITLNKPNSKNTVADEFNHRFNVLIKKLNQQLIWRLHRERDPLTRPYIKDFPLQMELLKEFTRDFLNKFTATGSKLFIKEIFLTSALQEKPKEDIENYRWAHSYDHASAIVGEAALIHADAQEQDQSIMLYQDPLPASRPYFIKQLISHCLGNIGNLPSVNLHGWKIRGLYTAFIAMTGMALYVIGYDFKQGIDQAYAVQANVNNYQVTVKEIQDPAEHFTKTLNLLISLQPIENIRGYKLDLAKLFKSYSTQSQQKTVETYQQALQAILLPEIRNYFAEYLTMPVNKNPELLYASLQSYLMLGDATHFQSEFIIDTLSKVLPKGITAEQNKLFSQFASVALKTVWSPMVLDNVLIEQSRRFCANMPGHQLAYIILKHINSNDSESLVSHIESKNVFAQQKDRRILNMFTAKSFPTVINEETMHAAQEALSGNWVLGDIIGTSSPELLSALVEQLRATYLSNYTSAWEKFINNLDISAPNNLAQLDEFILNIISDSSPLLQILQTVHDNTYFEPITSTSEKLQSLGLLLENRNQAENQLYQIFSSLKNLHEYLQKVLTAGNKHKAAFVIVSNRMLDPTNSDAITQLRFIAVKSPEPVKHWLETIANHSWHFLMKEAGGYIDTSWQEQVTKPYQQSIANHYPFTTTSDNEVAIEDFKRFFGNPGIISNFYQYYLRQFVDNSSAEWRWKTLDNMKMPFSDDILRQLQYAMRIQQTYFPNGDDQLFVQFSLQPYQLGKSIQSVKLSINDKLYVDQSGIKNVHMVAWPNSKGANKTFIQLTLKNKKVINQEYPGTWGWLKLMNQTFENMINKKEVLINLSKNEHTAKYLVYVNNQSHPFLTLNMAQFHLPKQLVSEHENPKN